MINYDVLKYLSGFDPTFDRSDFVLGAQLGLISIAALAIFAQLLLRLF